MLVLPCPHCGQTINTSMTACPYCGQPIDARVAAEMAEKFSSINAACNDASTLKAMGGVTAVFFVLLFVPLLGMIGYGFYLLAIAIPILAIRWWTRYGALQSTDPEFDKAEKTVIWFGAGSAVFFVLAIVTSFMMRRS